jgi:nicotinate-nucleotide adenylyltransferase
MDERASGHPRVAFFGGSFDPPHLGHLAVARAAKAALGLDTVLFVPVGAQPLKPLGSTAAFTDRVAMTRLAIASEPGFAVSLVDGPKPSGEPNYTLETLLRLRGELPGGGTLFCLMGADSFAGLRRWHRAAEIPFAAALIVASRPGQRMDDLEAALPAGLTIEAIPKAQEMRPEIEVCCYSLLDQAGERAPFYLLPGLEIEISASDIREQLRGGAGGSEPGRALVSGSVAEYIHAHGLYS